MKMNNLNKKLVNNLILGSSLYGTSVSIMTQVQATSTPPQGRQGVHQYNEEATEQLRALLAKSETPLKECMSLVQFNNADPNIQVGLFTLLEEAVLRRNYRMKDLIDKGADIHRITNKQVERDEHGNIKRVKYGRTLLHLAVYPPQKVRELLYQHKWKKIHKSMDELAKKNKKPTRPTIPEAPAPEVARKEALEKALHKREIDAYISCINNWDDLLSPQEKGVKELLDCGLGIEEITLQEAPDEERPPKSPEEIVRDCIQKLLESKLQQSEFHKAVKKHYDAIDKLFKEQKGENIVTVQTLTI
ncbi:MAG: hypothetical protein LBF34_02940 [Puniceicoccales bacterium]|jgi:hypothetical protein|nr:hypothetical protein [Puniceicoccales bacterium]